MLRPAISDGSRFRPKVDRSANLPSLHHPLDVHRILDILGVICGHDRNHLSTAVNDHSSVVAILDPRELYGLGTVVFLVEQGHAAVLRSVAS